MLSASGDLKMKELIKLVFIYNALEKGWVVKKGRSINSFEFTKPLGFTETKNKNKHLFIRRSISEPLTQYNIV